MDQLLKTAEKLPSKNEVNANARGRFSESMRDRRPFDSSRNRSNNNGYNNRYQHDNYSRRPNEKNGGTGQLLNDFRNLLDKNNNNIDSSRNRDNFRSGRTDFGRGSGNTLADRNNDKGIGALLEDMWNKNGENKVRNDDGRGFRNQGYRQQSGFQQRGTRNDNARDIERQQVDKNKFSPDTNFRRTSPSSQSQSPLQQHKSSRLSQMKDFNDLNLTHPEKHFVVEEKHKRYEINLNTEELIEDLSVSKKDFAKKFEEKDKEMVQYTKKSHEGKRRHEEYDKEELFLGDVVREKKNKDKANVEIKIQREIFIPEVISVSNLAKSIGVRMGKDFIYSLFKNILNFIYAFDFLTYYY